MAHQDVFISYSRPDAEAAAQLVAHLEAHGIECWYAARDVPAGAYWPEEIVHAIAEARVMVLIFSAYANNSLHVRREVRLASDKNVPVVPFRLGEVMPSGGLEYFVSEQQWIDAFPAPLEPHYARLVHCVNAVRPRPEIVIPPIVPPEPVPAPPKIHDASVENSASPIPVPPPRPKPLAIESAKLRRLEAELAAYIGPIAKWKVECAASEADDLPAMMVSLGGEIETERDRTRFLTSCRQLLC